MTVLKQAIKVIKTNDSDQRRMVAEILNELGIVYFRQEKLDKAEAVTDQAMQMSADHGAGAMRAQALNNLGLIYQKRHRYDKAEQAYKSSLKTTKELFGQLHPDVALVLVNLGLLIHRDASFQGC
jgi:eukaryotic-like serine/threonine-protein kinase